MKKGNKNYLASNDDCIVTEQECIAVNSKKRINSRDKGKRGERQFRDFMQQQGFNDASGAESPDVNIPSLPSLHFEVKVGRQVPMMIYDAVTQSIRDGNGKIPITAMKRDYCDWLIVMRASDWVGIIKETERVSAIFCPACKGTKVCKNGSNYKGKHKYLCLDESCPRVSFFTKR